MFHVEQQTASDVSFDFLVKIELSNLYDVRDTRRNHQTRNDLKVRRLKCLHYGTVAPCNVPLEQNLITRFVLFFLSLPKVSVQRKELIVVPFCEYSVWITFFESPPPMKKKNQSKLLLTLTLNFIGHGENVYDETRLTGDYLPSRSDVPESMNIDRFDVFRDNEFNLQHAVWTANLERPLLNITYEKTVNVTQSWLGTHWTDNTS